MDAAAAHIVGGKATLNPTFDPDPFSQHHIQIDAGAFVGHTSGQISASYGGSGSLNCSTVMPGKVSLANAATSQAMDASGAVVAGHS